MKQLCAKICLVTALLFTGTIAAMAQTQNAIISFLKEVPKGNIHNCTGDDLINLLDDDAKKWVESIECNNIDIVSGRSGVLINGSVENKNDSWIKIRFKTTSLMNCLRINTYAIVLDNKTPVTLMFDENVYLKKTIVDFKKDLLSMSAQNIYDAIINKNNTTTTVPFTVGSEIDPSLPLHSVSICIPKQKQNANVQFYGFRIFYNGITVENDISTGVSSTHESLENEKPVYYDLTGVRSAVPPASGIYIRKTGNRIEKIVAGGRK